MHRDVRKRMTLFPLLAGLLLACGTPSTQDGGTPAGGGDGGGFLGNDGGGGGTTPSAGDGPVINIITPKAAATVIDPHLMITADIAPGKDGADILSAQVNVRGLPKPVPMALRGGTKSTYDAQIGLNGTPSGSVPVTVQAVDAKNLTSTVSVNISWDAGPTVSIATPQANQAFKSSLLLTLTAKSDPRVTTGGDLASISFSVQGVDLSKDLKIDKSSNVLWTASATVSFTDARFKAGLSGQQSVHVVVTDKNGAKGMADQPFVVDNEGPLIVINSPTTLPPVGGIVNITATITDPAGVDGNSVLAVWLHDPVNYGVFLTRSGATSTFTGHFDVRRLPYPQNLIYVTLDVIAADQLGNYNHTNGIEIALDNTPPVLSLDPPMTQVATSDTMGGLMCSTPFFPTGHDSSQAADGRVLTAQEVIVRARVVDQGNISLDGSGGPSAGNDPDSIDLFVSPLAIDGSSPPLVVDADGKGTCNDLNPGLSPVPVITASNEALALRMSMMSGGGLAYSADQIKGFNMMVCHKTTPPMMLPPALCTGIAATDPNFSFVLPNEIFTIPPIGAANCGGIPLDFLNLLPPPDAMGNTGGAFCLAVRGRDKAGNQNVSKPIRLCIDVGGSGLCADFKSKANDGTLPTCMGKYDPLTQSLQKGMSCMAVPDPAFPLGSEPEIM